jgi:hypothetical protein
MRLNFWIGGVPDEIISHLAFSPLYSWNFGVQNILPNDVPHLLPAKSGCSGRFQMRDHEELNHAQVLAQAEIKDVL